MESPSYWTNVPDYFYVPHAYSVSNVVEPPPVEALSYDTSHPQLSSIAFNYEVYSNVQDPRDFLPTFSLIEMNSEGFYIVGTNDFNSSITDGNFIGCEDFESIVHHNIENTKFQIPLHSSVTGLKFLKSDLFVTTKMDNSVEIYSTKQPIGGDGKFKSFKISEQYTDGYTTCIDKLMGEAKFIVGTTIGHISTFDYGSATVMSDEIMFAHAAEITGVSAHPSAKKIWASCSNDRSCLQWDKTYENPAKILLDHEHRLTAVHWSSQEENRELVMLGDEMGQVLTVDPRAPNKILNTTKISNRPIKSIHFNGSKNFGVISNSEVMKIIETGNGSDPLKLVHEQTMPGTLYDMCWDVNDKNTFYVVGDGQFAIKITLS